MLESMLVLLTYLEVFLVSTNKTALSDYYTY